MAAFFMLTNGEMVKWFIDLSRFINLWHFSVIRNP